MKLLNKILVTVVTSISFQANAQQVLVSHPDYPTSHLKLIGENQGLLLPNVELENISTAAPLASVVDGMMVYNTNVNMINGNGKGVYTFINDQWVFAGENFNYQIIKDYNFLPELGYEVGNASNAVANFISDRVTYSNKGCFSDLNVSDSEYCLYEATSTNGVTWKQAFNAAKDINGHLVTITSKKEQEALKSFVGTHLPTWLGLTKVYKKDNAGQNSIIIPHLYNITGEEFEVEWSNEPKQYNNFGNTRSTNVTDNCVMMKADGFWQESNCNLNSVKTIIVEYKKN